MGSDAEQKNELDPQMLKHCDQYVPDNQLQTSVLGELHHALKQNIISSKEKFNELGDIINDPSLGTKNIYNKLAEKIKKRLNIISKK